MRAWRFIVAVLLISCLICGLLQPPCLVRAADVPKRGCIIVLGTDALKTSAGVKAFIDYKSTSFDVSTISMSDIARQFPGVSDSVEALRQYLDTKVQAVPPYVLLVGTMDEIPMSMFCTYLDRPEFNVLTDACLLYDKPLSFFDGNGNGKSGEYSEYVTSGLIQKFVIGRFPTDSTSILNSYFPLLLDAEKKYENTASLSGMVACAVENFTNFRYDADVEGEEVKAALPSVSWTSLYEKEGAYTSSFSAVPLNAVNFASAYNKGLDVLYVSAHGGCERRIFNDKNNDGAYESGEEQVELFWSKFTDLRNTVFLGYLNGCNTFPDATWTTPPFPPYTDNMFAGKLLNFVGYATVTTITRDIPSLNDVFGDLGRGYSIGDSIAIARAATPEKDILWGWWGIAIAGDPSARLNNKASATEASILSAPSARPGSPIRLSWGKADPACAYTVQVSNSSDFGNLVKSGIACTNSYQIPALPVGNYYWRVQGFYDNGEGSWSEPQSFSVADPITLTVDDLPGEVESPTVAVTGSTNADSIRINDLDATVANGRFSQAVFLKNGDNTIAVTAFKGTQTTTATRVVTYKKSLTLKLVIGTPTIWVNGAQSSLEAAPVIKNGRTLVPIRAIIEALGGAVRWDATAKKATVTLGSTSLQLWIGKSSAIVNGTTTPIDSTNAKVAPEIINGRTMLPLRFAVESLGADVSYDQAIKTITITYVRG